MLKNDFIYLKRCRKLNKCFENEIIKNEICEETSQISKSTQKINDKKAHHEKYFFFDYAKEHLVKREQSFAQYTLSSALILKISLVFLFENKLKTN